MNIQCSVKSSKLSFSSSRSDMVSVAVLTTVFSCNLLRFPGYLWDDEVRHLTLSSNQQSIADVGLNFSKLWPSSESLSKESSRSPPKCILQSILILSICENILSTFALVEGVINNIRIQAKHSYIQLSIHDL